MIGTTDSTWHHTENCFGIAGEDVVVGKEGGGKHSCHACILHAHLDGYCSLLGKREAEEATDIVAKHIAEGVVAGHHGKH